VLAARQQNDRVGVLAALSATARLNKLRGILRSINNAGARLPDVGFDSRYGILAFPSSRVT
jgi:hypothetical protein